MLLEFTEELPPLTNEEVYQVFANTLDLITGFSILFLQCSPAEANQLIPRVQQDLPGRKMGVLELGEPINNLYRLVEARADRASLNVLFIRGLENSLKNDIKPGYQGLGDYYNLNTVPPILSHLNQQRENFRDHFGNICFVFVLPRFAIRYFVRRAPDFYDWNSGVFKIENLSIENSITISIPTETWYQKIFSHFSGLRPKSKDLKPVQDDSFIAFFTKGNSLFNLGRYEEAIESYDRAISFKHDKHEAWYNRGNSLDNLGRYEDAIASYDRVIAINPNNGSTWHNKGGTYFKLGKYPESISCYDQRIALQPDRYNSWHDKGLVQFVTSDYQAALASWQQAFNYISDPAVPRYYEDISGLIQEFIEELIPRFTQPPIHQTLLIPLLKIYQQANVITELGTALINTLHLIVAPAISDHTAAEWLALWRTSSLGNEPAMELPLRLMSTAIEYKKDPSKRQSLWLNLPSEERPILNKALKIQ